MNLITIAKNILLSFITLTFSVSAVSAQEVKTLSLQEVLEKTKSIDAVKAKEFEIKKAELKKDMVEGNFRPSFNILAGIGPINKAYGDAINSTNSKVTDYHNWSALYLTNIQARYPLYAWGQKDDYLKAVRLGKEIGTHQVEQLQNELQFKAKQVYFGNLLANNVLDFINEGIADVEAALKKVKKKNDKYRLKIFENMLKSKKEDASYQVSASLKGLKFFIGEKNPNTKIIPEQEWLEYDRRKLKPLEYYLEKVEGAKPELKQLTKAIDAKDNLAIAQGKSLLPRLGIFARYKFAYTNARPDQKSVFAYDPYNQNSLVVGAGFQWNLDFGITSSKSETLKAEALQLRAKKKNAARGINTLIQNTWRQIKALEKGIRHSSKALKYAKKFLNRTMIGGAIGIVNAKEVVDAYQARILTFNEYFQKIYQYNMAWAKLSLTVGEEVDPFILEKGIK